MEQQAKQQLRVAQAACNQLMWQMPSVLFHFPQGVHTDVKTQLMVSQLDGQVSSLWRQHVGAA